MKSITSAAAADYVTEMIEKKSTNVWLQIGGGGGEEVSLPRAQDIAWDK